MKVVHISPTPVAGAPIKIVNALRRYGKIDARFIDLAPNIYGRRTFPEDLCWPMDNNEIYNEIFSANIIHFHQNVSLKEPNLNIDFTNKNQFPKTHFIREWHSEPGLHKRLGKIDIDAFENESFPLLCMAQYHERYYPEAIPVPLLTNVEDLKENIQPLPFPPVVAYSPSTRLPLSEWRWTSKGYDETLTILRELQKNHNFSIDIIENTPWNEAIERKKKATIIIDDLVTGSFHTSGLEGLALGKPTFSFLDARTVATLAKLTNSNSIPFINCPLEHFTAIFKHLIDDYNTLQSIGDYSKHWMNKYYHEKILIQHYINIYKKLSSNKLTERKRIMKTKGDYFLSTHLYDLLFHLRHKTQSNIS